MKNLFTCIGLVLLLPIISLKLNGQTNVVYDFKTKTFADKPKPSKINNTVTVKVENINTLLYDVEVIVDNKTYHTEAPALFLGYFPTISNIPSILEGVAAAAETVAETKESDESVNLLELVMKEVQLWDGGNNNKSMPKQNNSCEYLIDSLLRKLRVEQKAKQLNEKQARKAVLNTLLKERISDFDKLVEILQDISYTTAVLRNPIVDGLDYTESAPNKERLKKDIKQLYDMFFASDKKYLEIDELYTSYSSVEVLKLRALKHLSDSIRSLINIDNYIALTQLLDKSNFYFITPPIQVHGDNIAISIKITPKQDTASKSIVLSSLKGEKVELEIPTKCRFGISFSTGFMGSKLQDYNYSTKTNYGAADTTFSIVQENTGDFVFGPTALMHASWTIVPKFAMGLHLGVAIPIVENPNPQFMLGGSFLLGLKQRLCLNAGWALGSVKRLSESTDANLNYKETPVINTKKQTHSGFAFSITYNFD
jgi:hypothetical protein